MSTKFIPLVLKQLHSQLKSGHRPIVVVSAVKGVTDSLLDFLHVLGSHKAQTDSLIDDFVDGQLRTHAELLKTVGVIDKEILQILVTLKKHLANLRSDLKKYSKGNHSSQLEAKIASYGERLSAVLVAGYV